MSKKSLDKEDDIASVFFKVLVSLFFAILYVSIPWAEIRGSEFVDYQRYIVMLDEFGGLDVAYDFSLSNILAAFSNEVLWWKIISSIFNYTNDGQATFLIISFVVVFVYCSFLIKRTTFLNVVIILFNPLIIDLVFSQVRSAFAFAIVLLCYHFRKKRFAWVVLLSSCFIHSAMLILLFSLIILWLILEVDYLSNRVKAILSWLFGFCLAVIMVYGVSYILGSIEDRRSDYGTVATQSSTVAYALYWLLLGGLLVLKANVNDREVHYFSLVGIFVSSLFFFLCVFNFYGSRFLALLLPFFMLAVFNVKLINPRIIKMSYIAYFSTQFYYWL